MSRREGNISYQKEGNIIEYNSIGLNKGREEEQRREEGYQKS